MRGDHLLILGSVMLFGLTVSCQLMPPPITDQAPPAATMVVSADVATELPSGSPIGSSTSPGQPPAPIASATALPLATPQSKPTTSATSSRPQPVAASTVFGVEMDRIARSAGLDSVTQAKTGWIRRNVVLWSDVEPTPGARNWAALSAVEEELRTAAANGIPVIMIVRGTPTWARKTHAACGTIKKDALGSFGIFMRDFVTRYSVPPFNVEYWELWNEPDIDPANFDDQPYGCWGDQGDPYYGGGYFAEMLQAVYPRIKAANSKAQVLVGGLLLDCDPDHPPASKDCRSAKFLEGIVKSGGGAYFDGVSFHAYDYYLGALGQYSNANWASSWDTTGPVVIAKARFIKRILQKYNVSGKFLMNTESAILCDGGPARCDSAYETTKVYYLTQIYATAIREGLRANLWYSVLGWRSSGLLNSSQQPLPAFAAYSFGSRELRGAQFSRDITDWPLIKGYEFSGGDRRIWLLWSADRATHSIRLPQVPRAIYHADGTPITVSNSLGVSMEPLYVEWSP